MDDLLEFAADAKAADEDSKVTDTQIGENLKKMGDGLAPTSSPSQPPQRRGGGTFIQEW